MNLRRLIVTGIVLMSVPALAYSASCEPNNLGGQFCINDNGTTSDSLPNEVSGEDTYSNNGKWTSTIPDGAGANAALDGSTLPDPDENDGSSSSSAPDSALMGRDWNSASNIQSDGAATSSAAIANSQ